MSDISLPVAKTREDRLKFADGMVSQLKRRYGSDLLGVGIYGSTARGEDLPYSDIELLATLGADGISEYNEAILAGLKCGVKVVSKSKVVDEINEVDINWPTKVGKYLQVKVLHEGEAGLFDGFRQVYETVVAKDFGDLIARVYIEDVYEELCKYWNMAEANDEGKMRILIPHIFEVVCQFLGVVNKTYYQSFTSMGETAMNLPINFASFKKLGEAIFSGDMRNTVLLTETIKGLWGEIEVYLQKEGLNYQSDLLTL